MAGKKMQSEQSDDVVKQPSVDAAEDDVEGHGMLPMDPSSARYLTAAREADIRRTLQRHGLEAEARRPHKRDR